MIALASKLPAKFWSGGRQLGLKLNMSKEIVSFMLSLKDIVSDNGFYESTQEWYDKFDAMRYSKIKTFNRTIIVSGNKNVPLKCLLSVSETSIGSLQLTITAPKNSWFYSLITVRMYALIPFLYITGADQDRLIIDDSAFYETKQKAIDNYNIINAKIVSTKSVSLTEKPFKPSKVEQGNVYSDKWLDAFKRAGCKKIENIGGAGDGGSDLVGRTSKHIPFIVQCKNQEATVGPKVVRETDSAKRLKKAKLAFISAPNGYSKQAKDEARQLGVCLLSDEDMNNLEEKIEEAIQDYL